MLGIRGNERKEGRNILYNTTHTHTRGGLYVEGKGCAGY
jgi:hypothetical protein